MPSSLSSRLPSATGAALLRALTNAHQNGQQAYAHPVTSLDRAHGMFRWSHVEIIRPWDSQTPPARFGVATFTALYTAKHLDSDPACLAHESRYVITDAGLAALDAFDRAELKRRDRQAQKERAAAILATYGPNPYATGYGYVPGGDTYGEFHENFAGYPVRDPRDA